MLSEKLTRLGHNWRLLITLFSLLVATAYWISLEQSHRYMQQTTLQQTRDRAERLSKLSAIQIATAIQGLDFSLRSMANHYLNDGFAGLSTAARTALAAYPQGSILQIAMADASGQLRYSTLAAQPMLSIADREHFRVHLRQPGDTLYISSPVLGRVSKRWSIQLSRPVIDEGKLIGVLVLSLNPDYLGGMLSNFAITPDAVISLLHQNGRYLARSGGQQALIGSPLRDPRPLSAGHGLFEDPAHSPDARIAAWKTLPENGLRIVSSLDRKAALRSVNNEIARSRGGGILGSMLFLALTQGIAILLQRQARQRRQMQAIYKALPVGVLLTDPQFRILEGNHRAAELLGCKWETLAEHNLDELLHLSPGQALQQSQPITSHHACRHLDLLLTPPRHSPRWLSIRISLSHIAGSHYLLTISDISERHFSHDKIAQSEERLTLALQDADLSLWDINLGSMQVRLGAMSCTIIGLPAREQTIPFALWKSRIHPDDTAQQQRAQARHLRGEADRYQYRYRVQHQHGHWVWIQAHGKVVQRDQHGKPLRMVGTHRDISKQIEAERIQNEWLERLEKLTTQVPGVIYQYQLHADGTSCFPYCSPGIRNIYGVGAEDIREDATPVFSRLHPDDYDMIVQSIVQSARILDNWELEYRVHDPDGQIRWLHGRAKPERLDDGSTLWHGYISDITQRKEAESRLRYLATTDPLTGLANRREFSQRAETELSLCQRHSAHYCSLVMLDIDFFKHVNDSYGHAIGDLVLRQLAALIRSSLRGSDIAGRLGGEEFAILLPLTDDKASLHYAERLRMQIEDYAFGESNNSFRLTASMGISALVASDLQLDAALARADKALYQAKNSGRNRVCRHSLTLDNQPPQPA